MNDENIKTNSLVDESHLKTLDSLVKRIISNDDEKKAFELSALLDKAMVNNAAELKANNEIFNFYKNIIIKLKFIALSLLSENEIIELLNNYFVWQFTIEHYDFIDKFKKKLLYIVVYEDRDKFKEDVKKSLLENGLIITRETERKAIKDWLNDYNSNLGLGVADKLKRTQYLINLKRIRNLQDFEIERLKILFNLYEFLKISSLSPEGFDEDVLIDIDGSLQVFSRGNLESISGVFTKARDVSGPPKTTEEKTIEDLIAQKKTMKDEGIAGKVIEEQIDNTKKVEELKIMLNKYKDNSLQKRAIEEEIRKLEAK
ncbi:MAG: hypothetical protein NTW06_02800 [Candidatus Falkowbacteria bacterium]|nr:hypothetical protein [Candidatus Falkowbacteria bacterium]